MDGEASGLVPEQLLDDEGSSSMEGEAVGRDEEDASMDLEASGLAPEQSMADANILVALGQEPPMDSAPVASVTTPQLGAEAQPALEAIVESTHISPQRRQLHRQASAATAASSYLDNLSDADSSESTTIEQGPPQGGDQPGEHLQTEMPEVLRLVCFGKVAKEAGRWAGG